MVSRFAWCFTLLSPRSNTSDKARNFSKSQSLYGGELGIFPSSRSFIFILGESSEFFQVPGSIKGMQDSIYRHISSYFFMFSIYFFIIIHSYFRQISSYFPHISSYFSHIIPSYYSFIFSTNFFIFFTYYFLIFSKYFCKQNFKKSYIDF